MVNRYNLFCLRTLIVFFWVSIVFLFLYFPALRNLWHSQRVINVMTWADLIDADVIKQFEQETGIKVRLSYFESNEELYARFKATGGKGHDLILPSDFMVETLVADGLLKPLDQTKLTMWSRLDSRLLHLYYDPENRYSIPYYWAINGIGYNKQGFKGTHQLSWNTVFNECSKEKPLIMPDSAREVLSLAAYYLFGSIENLDAEKMKKIQELLLQQKACVGAYSESRADYLLIVKEFELAIVPSAVIWRSLNRYPYIDFVVPHDGTFVMIDNFAIPKHSKNEDHVYSFLNFLYRKEIIRHTFEHRRFLPATVDLIPLLQEHGAAPSVIEAHSTEPSSWQFFKNVLPSQFMEETWIALKAK